MEASPHALRDPFGCQVDKLQEDRQIRSPHIRFFRKAADRGPGQVVSAGVNEGYLLGVSLSAGHQRKIFREHHATIHDFERDAIYLRAASEDYKADLAGSFNFVLMEITRHDLEAIADQADLQDVSALSIVTAEPDAMLASLVRSLFAAHPASNKLNELFVDQIACGIGVHLVNRYGNGRKFGGHPEMLLSVSQENLVKDAMLQQLGRVPSIDELAGLVGMGAATFIRAFRKSTGMAPSAWYEQARLDIACALLRRSSMDIDEIVIACGYSGRSHMRRIFEFKLGVTPEAWRSFVLC